MLPPSGLEPTKLVGVEPEQISWLPEIILLEIGGFPTERVKGILLLTQPVVVFLTVRLKLYKLAALVGIETRIGLETNEVLFTLVNEGMAFGVPAEIEYWLGEPAPLVKGRLNVVAVVNTLLIVPSVMLGKTFTIPVTASTSELSPLE